MAVSKQVMKFLKARAISIGITQQMIAKKFDVSLPTVKRWYAGKFLDLDKLSEICTYLGVELSEAICSIESDKKRKFIYTDEQERFFSSNPEYLAFFDNLLRGYSVSKIQKKFSLKKVKVENILSKLDKYHLIEWLPNNKAKILVKGEPVWKNKGPLSKAFRESIINAFLERSSSEQEVFLLQNYTQEDLTTLKSKLGDLIDFSTKANKRAALSADNNRPFGLFISLKNFRWTLDEYLRN